MLDASLYIPVNGAVFGTTSIKGIVLIVIMISPTVTVVD